MTLAERAYTFASHAHRNQVRKYTGEAYMTHCVNVAELVRAAGLGEEAIAAAYLHDTVEDTTVTLEEVDELFGGRVAELVYWLTDVSRPEDGNRATRKAKDRAHLALAPAEAQTIKLADLVDNCRSITAHDPSFAKVFLAEKAALLEVLTKGNAELMRLARSASHE